MTALLFVILCGSNEIMLRMAKASFPEFPTYKHSKPNSDV